MNSGENGPVVETEWHGPVAGFCEHGNDRLGSIKDGEFD
jgi:hypothetical protein